MNWLIFALLTPFFWSFTNILDKILTTKYVKPIDYAILGGFIWLINLVFLPLSNLRVISLTFVLLLLFVGAIRIFSFLFYLKAMQIEEVSRVSPLGNLSPLFVLIMSVLFLKESLTQSQLIAFFLIFVGGFVLSIKRIKGLLRLSKALGFIILNTFLFALSYVLLKFAYGHITLWDGLVLYAFGEIIASFILLINQDIRKRFLKSVKSYNKKIWLFIAVDTIFALLGNLTSNAAILLGPVSLVAVVGGFQGLLVLIWAIYLSRYFPKILKEEIDRKVLLIKAFAISLMIGGLYLLHG